MFKMRLRPTGAVFRAGDRQHLNDGMIKKLKSGEYRLYSRKRKPREDDTHIDYDE
jgi:hypothetical protein